MIPRGLMATLRLGRFYKDSGLPSQSAFLEKGTRRGTFSKTSMSKDQKNVKPFKPQIYSLVPKAPSARGK